MRYVLDPEDTILLLGEAEKQIVIDSHSRMLFFSVSDVQSAGYVKRVRTGKTFQPAFRFTAADALLGSVYEVLIVESHKDYVNFTKALLKQLPERKLHATVEELPPQCDGGGHHFA